MDPEGIKLLQIIGKERAETSTVVKCINTAGESIKPMIIHHEHRVQGFWLRGVPEGVVISAFPKGYINNKTFYEWGRCSLNI